MKWKSKLKESVSVRIKTNEDLLKRIGKRLGIDAASLRRSIVREAPSLCLPHSTAIIREELALPPNEEIVEIVYEETYLHQ